jgi:hypothetical protein
MNNITKAIIAMIFFIIAIGGAIITAEDRYISSDEMRVHCVKINNIMVHKELSYAIERCAKLQEKLVHGQDNFRVRIELEACIAQRDIIRTLLQ